jgi:FkbM family methyltransferase
VPLRHPDAKAPVYVRIPGSSDLPVFDQVFLRKEYAFKASPPKVVVDAGANIGLASVLFASRFPDATVIAIEPDAKNYAVLAHNVAPYPNVIPLHAALWNENTTIRMHDPGLGEWGYMTASDGEGAEVKAVTIGWLLEEYGLEKIDILKMDIEGAEREVFSDFRPWIDRVGSIIIELHEQQSPGATQAVLAGARGFNHEWVRGENNYWSRSNVIAPA